MKLIGNLKKKVENAKTKEEARDTIKKAGMLLDDDELEQVSGGGGDLLKGLFDTGLQAGDKVLYFGDSKEFYGQEGTISVIIYADTKAKLVWCRVRFGKGGQLECSASDLEKVDRS